MAKKARSVWRRCLALGLSAVMALSLTACGNSDTGDDTDNGKLNTGIDDSVVDLGGYEFTVGTPFMQDKMDANNVMASEAIFDEIRRKVEKDYHCKITVVPVTNDVERVRTKVIAGEKIADIIEVEGFDLLPMARAGYIVPLESVKGLDITDKRYIQSYMNCTEFNGSHYGITWMRPPQLRSLIVYNRDLLKKLGITEDPQELAKSGQWTFDKFREMCKTATNAADGVYGCFLTLPDTFGVNLISANGGSLVKSENGVASENFNTPQAITALNFMNDLINTDKSTVHCYTRGIGSEDNKVNAANFVAGKYLFYYCEGWQLTKNIRPVAENVNYGIVPLPKGPDATGYVTPSENAGHYCITSTNKDLDKTVIVLNALAKYTLEYSEGDWWQYETEMDFFHKGDTASVEMYYEMIDHATLDMGVGVPDLWSGFKEDVITAAILKNQGTPASKIDAITGKYKSAIDAAYN